MHGISKCEIGKQEALSWMIFSDVSITGNPEGRDQGIENDGKEGDMEGLGVHFTNSSKQFERQDSPAYTVEFEPHICTSKG